MPDCLFCKIIAGQIPANVVYRDEQSLGFEDIHPVAPVHILFVPKRHLDGVNSMQQADGETVGHLFWAAAKYARERGIETSGYRLVANVGPDAGQTVFHLHLHLLGGKPLRGSATSGRGD
jgi:histidine triad (HIT) family protein